MLTVFKVYLAAKQNSPWQRMTQLKQPLRGLLVEVARISKDLKISLRRFKLTQQIYPRSLTVRPESYDSWKTSSFPFGIGRYHEKY